MQSSETPLLQPQAHKKRATKWILIGTLLSLALVAVIVITANQNTTANVNVDRKEAFGLGAIIRMGTPPTPRFGQCARTSDCHEGTCCGVSPNNYCTNTCAKSVIEGDPCRCDEECDDPIDAINFKTMCQQGTCVKMSTNETSEQEEPCPTTTNRPTQAPTPTLVPLSCSSDTDCWSGTACCGSDSSPSNKFCSNNLVDSLAVGEQCHCDAECANDVNALLQGVCEQGTCVQQSVSCTNTSDCLAFGVNGTCCHGMCTSIPAGSVDLEVDAPCSCRDECLDPCVESGGRSCASGKGYCAPVGTYDMSCPSGGNCTCRWYCLAADSQVTIMRNGQQMEVDLNETVRGDWILVVDEKTGEMFFDEIMLFHHFGRDSGRAGVAQVNVIEWEMIDEGSGEIVIRNVKITDGHLIYVAGDGGRKVIRDAKEVTRGDKLFVNIGEQSLEEVVVTNVRREMTQIANVVTRHGNYLANGVLVSSHMGTVEADHRLKNVVFGVYFDLLPKLVWWKDDVDFFDFEWIRVSLRAMLHVIARARGMNALVQVLSA